MQMFLLRLKYVRDSNGSITDDVIFLTANKAVSPRPKADCSGISLVYNTDDLFADCRSDLW